MYKWILILEKFSLEYEIDPSPIPSPSQKKLPSKSPALQGLNTLFKNAVSSLDINENSGIINQNFQNTDDLVDRAIGMYKYHQSIFLINNKVDNHSKL